MGNLSARAERLGKQYEIGRRQCGYKTLRESLYQGFGAPFRWLKGGQARRSRGAERVWALREVSFEVRRGEVVGVIGRNGAGKSTLLKVLSRITEPTEGRAELYGRVGSLLEVGTGFHPELSGRENIFLSGAILGMRKADIVRKLDDIVAFAEIERYLDTPVKRYSSGMYLRLAFSVAAHLEPEILVVDEVLAVGDAAFQARCLGKMSQIADGGRTVIFVSHNLAAVQALCSRGIYLKSGMVQADAGVGEVVRAYLRDLEEHRQEDLGQRRDRRGAGNVKLVRVEVCPGAGGSGELQAGGPARFELHFDGKAPGLSCGFAIHDSLGRLLTGLSTLTASSADRMNHRSAVFACEIPELLLVPGSYYITAALRSNGELEDHVEGATFFNVAPGTVNGRQVDDSVASFGPLHLPHRWVLPKL